MKKSKFKNHKIRNPVEGRSPNGTLRPQSAIRNPQSKICNPHGFTLIELAIVMIVVGLLIGLGAGLVGPLMKRAKYTQSRGIVDAAVASVVAYAAGNEDLPDNGGGTTDFKKIVSSPTDAFTKTLLYIPDSSLSVADDDKVCKQKAGEITVYACNNSACSTYDTINNVAFVVASGGSNMNIQAGSTTMPTGAACPTTTCVIDYEQDTASIDDYTTDGNNPDNYDDIVKWVTVNELRTKAGCTGSLLKILNNELPSAISNSAYNATIYADGGVTFAGGFYEWCTTNATPTNLYYCCPSGTTLGASGSCTLTGIGETWNQCTSLSIMSDAACTTPAASSLTAGSYSLTFYVRDESDSAGTNDNITKKTFVLTVNP